MPRKPRAKPAKHERELPVPEAADLEHEATAPESSGEEGRGRDIERDEPVQRSTEMPEH